VGVVTLEDIVEEIIGHDVQNPAEKKAELRKETVAALAKVSD